MDIFKEGCPSAGKAIGAHPNNINRQANWLNEKVKS